MFGYYNVWQTSCVFCDLLHIDGASNVQTAMADIDTYPGHARIQLWVILNRFGVEPIYYSLCQKSYVLHVELWRELDKKHGRRLSQTVGILTTKLIMMSNVEAIHEQNDSN
jgi:hypothetical protein